MKPPFWNAESIKSARKILKISQRELAEALGNTQQQVSEWEQGAYIPGRAYQKLLYITIDKLFEERKNVSLSCEK